MSLRGQGPALAAAATLELRLLAADSTQSLEAVAMRLGGAFIVGTVLSLQAQRVAREALHDLRTTYGGIVWRACVRSHREDINTSIGTLTVCGLRQFDAGGEKPTLSSNTVWM